MCIYTETYCKGSAHVIVKAWLAHNLMTKASRLATQESFSSSWRQYTVKPGNTDVVDKVCWMIFFCLEEVNFLLYSGLQLIGCDPPALGQAICFTQFIDSNVSLIQKHLYRYTQNNVWPNVWAPRGPSSWCIKLTIIASFWHLSISQVLKYIK